MQIGTIIKSFDFPGNTSCYMVGVVTDIKGDEISCNTIKQVFDNKALDITEFNQTFRTVRQGASFMDDMSKFDRVVVIG